MTRRNVCWLLVGAVALIASLAGHAVQLAIESHIVGGVRAGYNHSLQTPIAYLALILVISAAFSIARGVIDRLRNDVVEADWLVPALEAIRQIGVARLIVVIIGLQLAAFIVGELGEQAIALHAGFDLGAILGPGHFTAPLLHIVIGSLAALALAAFARFVCNNIKTVARFARTIVAWVSAPARIRCAPAMRLLAQRFEAAFLPALATHIASRPPPAFATLLA